MSEQTAQVKPIPEIVRIDLRTADGRLICSMSDDYMSREWFNRVKSNLDPK